MNTRVLLIALGLAGSLVFGASVNESAAPAAVDVATGAAGDAVATAPTRRAIATLPTVAPAHAMTDSSETTPPRSGFAATSLPRLDPHQRTASLPTVTPSREPQRAGCDPAYPEARTCIPPGPPFNQGCAITAERLFTVLAPDRQGLDHDQDGIGCEPIPG